MSGLDWEELRVAYSTLISVARSRLQSLSGHSFKHVDFVDLPFGPKLRTRRELFVYWLSIDVFNSQHCFYHVRPAAGDRRARMYLSESTFEKFDHSSLPVAAILNIYKASALCQIYISKSSAQLSETPDLLFRSKEQAPSQCISRSRFSYLQLASLHHCIHSPARPARWHVLCGNHQKTAPRCILFSSPTRKARGLTFQESPLSEDQPARESMLDKYRMSSTRSIVGRVVDTQCHKLTRTKQMLC